MKIMINDYIKVLMMINYKYFKNILYKNNKYKKIKLNN